MGRRPGRGRLGAISPQTSFFGGSSDGQDNNCQNLNLWTPGTGDAEKRPVMVWFHGGGMTSGSANGDGRHAPPAHFENHSA